MVHVPMVMSAFWECVPAMADERSSVLGHLWGARRPGRAEKLKAMAGLQGRGGRSGYRLQEVGASKEHITHRFPVPTIEAPVVGSAVTDALGHLLGPRGRIEVIALAENDGILAASYGVNPPS